MTKSKKNLTKSTLMIVAICAGIYFGGTAIFHYFTKPKVTVETSKSGTGITLTTVTSSKSEAEQRFPMDMNEDTMQQTIHEMSHQKIVADKKWGAIPLTDENVNRLVDVINHSNYQYADVYLEILHRWQNHDFTRVDEDHNTIWQLQGGVVGKATGIMTAEEEQQYIKQNYAAN